MSFVSDLGEAIATAITSGSSNFTGIGGLNAEYGDQPKDFNVKTARAYVRSDGHEVLEDYEASAHSIFRFLIFVAVIDVKAANESLGVLQHGLRNVFINSGRTILNTHLTDTGSNRLAKSGECRLTSELEAIDNLENKDHPMMMCRAEVECWHVMPLV